MVRFYQLNICRGRVRPKPDTRGGGRGGLDSRARQYKESVDWSHTYTHLHAHAHPPRSVYFCICAHSVCCRLSFCYETLRIVSNLASTVSGHTLPYATRPEKLTPCETTRSPSCRHRLRSTGADCWKLCIPRGRVGSGHTAHAVGQWRSEQPVLTRVQACHLLQGSTALPTLGFW